MVFTDPPYNVPIDGHVGGKGKVKHREFAMASGEMSAAEFTDFLTRALRGHADHSLDGSIHFVCMDWRHMREVLGAGAAVYDALKNLIVWVKDNGGMGTFYRSRHELIFAFKKGSAAHVNSFELGQHGRYRTNVWQYRGVNTMKAGRMGQRDIRRLLITGAMAVINAALRTAVPEGSWLGRMLARKPRMLVAIALANRMARRLWAMSIKEEDYREPACTA